MNDKIRNLKEIFHSGTLSFDGIILTIVKVVTMMVSIINTMFLSRLLSLNEYGIYSQLLVVVNISSIILSMGLNNAVNYFYNKYDNEKNKYIENIFNITTLIGFIGAILIILTRNIIADFCKNPVIAQLIIYIAFIPLLNNIVAIFQPLYISLKKAKLIAIINIIFSIIKVTLTVTVCITSNNIAWIFIVQVVLEILQIFILYLKVKDKVNDISLFRINIDICKKILLYAAPMTLALMSGVIFKESDKIIITNLASTEDLAIYSNMSKQLPFEFVVTSFTAVVTPIIVGYLKNDKEKAIELWMKFIEFSYIISWMLNIGAIICARELLIFLYSKKYIVGLNIFIIYLITELFRFTYFGLILSSSGKTKFITISSIISVVLNLLLNVILYRFLGLSGPAYATLITIIVMGTIQLIFSAKILDTGIFKVINLKKMVIYLFQLVLVGLLCYLLKTILYNFITNNFIILFVIYALFIIINLFISKKKIFRLLEEMK